MAPSVRVIPVCKDPDTDLSCERSLCSDLFAQAKVNKKIERPKFLGNFMQLFFRDLILTSATNRQQAKFAFTRAC